jgi:hypothetical protein
MMTGELTLRSERQLELLGQRMMLLQLWADRCPQDWLRLRQSD